MNSLFKTNMPIAVEKFRTDLRIFIDQRDRQYFRHANVINLRHRKQQQQTTGLLDKYQELATPVKDFFFKAHQEITSEALMKFLIEIDRIEPTAPQTQLHQICDDLRAAAQKHYYHALDRVLRAARQEVENKNSPLDSLSP